ncbi:VENN motif pre-toxin domain-containing protein, partial [Gilliamella sp. B3464]|uniref:VENN motif pre-toxin domain-containing protein n=1 Tax=Gilliamella sp. B3464 TaxID=2818022 RepID=UPI00226A16DD
IASILYPNKSIDELNQDEKQQVSALAQLTTGLTIAALGGDAQDINTAIAGGKNAVENNYLSASEDKERKDAQAKLDLINKGSLVVSDEKKQELEGQVAILNALDAQRDEILNNVCQNLSSSECNSARIELQSAYDSYFKTLTPEDYLAYNDAYANYTKYYDGYKKILSQIGELEGRDQAAYNEYKAQNLSEGLGISIESARNLVKFDNAMHSVAIIGSMFVGSASVKDKNLNLTNQQMQQIKEAEKISTAKSGTQTIIPRDLNEQLFWKQVELNPLVGSELKGMNNDIRFDSSLGFQKMQAVYELSNGQKITIHYQYNSNTGKAYDMKITTPQRIMADPRDVLNSIKDKTK